GRYPGAHGQRCEPDNPSRRGDTAGEIRQVSICHQPCRRRRRLSGPRKPSRRIMAMSESAAASRAIHWLADSRLGKWCWYQHALTVYSFGLQPSHAARSPARVEKDSWTDLQCYRKTHGQPARDAFLAMSRQRLEAGEHAYTVCEHGELLAWAWMVPNQRR